jgi:hypothetical protein
MTKREMRKLFAEIAGDQVVVHIRESTPRTFRAWLQPRSTETYEPCDCGYASAFVAVHYRVLPLPDVKARFREAREAPSRRL